MKKLLAILLVLICLPVFGLAEAPTDQAEVPENITILSPDEGDLPTEGIAAEPYIPEEMDRAIINSDDRVTITNTGSYPYSAIAYMIVHNKCGCSSTGTAFMVGADWALTASHMLVCLDHQQWADEITFYFGYKNNRNYTYRYKGRWTAWVGNFPFESDRTTQAWWSDYGYIHFDDNKPGNKVGWFGMSPQNMTEGQSAYYTLAGYRDGELKKDYDRVTKESNVYVHYIDCLPGNSGSPIFTNDYYAVGIHVASGDSDNVAAPITWSIINYMMDDGFTY